MDTHELSANLPPLRDDEPPSLRQDILDELADHLRCALRREMLTQDDEAAARKRVLDKFGDPREVARQLWIQALWSKIMSQRITLGLLTLATAACLVLAGLMWQTTQQYQHVNAALLEQMAKLIEASRTPVPVPPTPDATLTVRLFNGEKGSRPPKWGSVSVVGTHLQNASIKGQRDGSSGVVEFGTIPAGAYQVKVQTARGETTRTASVLRGESHVEEFICPDDDLRQTNINVECDLPEDLKEKGIAAFALFDDLPFESKGNTWIHQRVMNFGIVVAVARDDFYFIETSSSIRDYEDWRIDTATYRRNWIGNLINFSTIRTPPTSPVRQYWTGGRFNIQRLALATDPRLWDVPKGRLPDGVAVVAARMKKGDANWPVELDVDYVVKEGQPWRITIPDHLIAEVRKQIAEAPAAKPESP